MAKRRRCAFIALVLLLCLQATAWSSEIEQLREEMRKTQETLLKMQAKLDELEKKQSRQAEEVKEVKQVVSSPESTYQFPEFAQWLNGLKVYGDFRFRYENIDFETNQTQQSSVNRNRIRLRIGFEKVINEELKVKARFATGETSDGVSSAARSADQSLEDDFSEKSFWLDRAFLEYTPDRWKGATVFAGKMAMPFWSPAQFVFDSEVNPEGGAFRYEFEPADELQMFTSLGGFWVEQLDSDYNQSLWGAQIGGMYSLDERSSLESAVTYYDYGNVEGEDLIAGRAYGNTTVLIGGENVYEYDFNLLDFACAYNTVLFEMPMRFYGDFVQNIAQDANMDTAWLLGWTLNKANKPGSWQFGYSYRDVERNSMLGTFAPSTFAGGRTGSKGHLFELRYQFMENVYGQISYYLNERARSATSNQIDDDYQRLQTDVVVKF